MSVIINQPTGPIQFFNEEQPELGIDFNGKIDLSNRAGKYYLQYEVKSDLRLDFVNHHLGGKAFIKLEVNQPGHKIYFEAVEFIGVKSGDELLQGSYIVRFEHTPYGTIVKIESLLLAKL